MFFVFLIITVWDHIINFWSNMKKDYAVRLSPAEEKVVEFISKKLANGKRIHELAMLNPYAGLSPWIF